MNGTSIFSESKDLRAFPDPQTVFANRVDEHAAYLPPVESLSLGSLSGDWEGGVHFIIPIEPCGASRSRRQSFSGRSGRGHPFSHRGCANRCFDLVEVCGACPSGWAILVLQEILPPADPRWSVTFRNLFVSIEVDYVHAKVLSMVAGFVDRHG